MITIEHIDTLHFHLQSGDSANTDIAMAALAAIRQTNAAVTAREPFTTNAGPAAPVQTPAQATTTPPALGALWPGQGGHYAGTMPARNGQPGYHLIVAEAQNASITWGPESHSVAGAADHYDGQANTDALIADDTEHPAAVWARAIEADGHKDFYLPAHAEACQLWINVPALFSTDGWYWTSTQLSPYYAWVQDFEAGISNYDDKDYERRAVAVRRLAL